MMRHLGKELLRTTVAMVAVWAAFAACETNSMRSLTEKLDASSDAVDATGGAPTNDIDGWDAIARSVDAAETDALASGASPDEMFAAGSRLRPLVMQFADGGRHFTGRWMDPELGVECELALAEDRAWRCLPAHSNYGGGYFSDPACSRRLIAVDKADPCQPEKFFILGSGEFAENCGETQPMSVYRNGGIYTGEIYVMAVGAGGLSCSIGVPLDSSELYALGPKMDPGAFVSADLVALEP